MPRWAAAILAWVAPVLVLAGVAACAIGAAPAATSAGVPGGGIRGRIPAQVVPSALGDDALTAAHSPASCRWFGEREGRFVAVAYDDRDPAERLGSLGQLRGAVPLDNLDEGGVLLHAASECGCSQVGGVALYVLQGDRLLYVSVPDGGDVPTTVRNARDVATTALAADR